MRKSKHGIARSFADLIAQIIQWTTDENIHGKDKWTLMRNEPYPRGTILRAHGRREGECQYIGFMPNTVIKGKTYYEWLFRYENLATYFLWGENGIQAYHPEQNPEPQRYSPIMNANIGSSFSFMNNGTISSVSIQGTVGEPFLYDAHIMSLGVFKGYSEGLDWAEQPGGIAQDFKLFPIPYIIPPSRYYALFYPPCLPGTEYPALSYEIDGLPLEWFDYWLVKDDRSLTIIMNNAEHWDCAYLGFFQPFDRGDKEGDYAFPATVIGGTSGLVSYGEDVSLGGPYPTPIIGAKFDYRPRNWSLTHGIAPFACQAEKDGATQVRAMLPNGCWRSFGNFMQIRKAVPMYQSNSNWYPLQAPEPSPNKNWIHPTESLPKDYAHIYCHDPHRHAYLTPLSLYEHDFGALGEIPTLCYPSVPLCEFGETTVDGKKYLAMPNGWVGRKWHLRAHCGAVNYNYVDVNQMQNDDFDNDKYSRIMNLMVRMED